MGVGQKQRIQIARALYEDADIYLFDDPFSAVDAHTGTHLFNACIMELLNSKTIIYVTHQVEFLPLADLILVMKEGQIKQASRYHGILTSGSDFIELGGAHEEALSALDSISTEKSTNDEGSSSTNAKLVFHAPISFFDSTPSGRILNRASTNQRTVDLNTGTVAEFSFAVIQLLEVVAVMILIISIPIIATYLLLQRYYISSTRELARFCRVSKALVIQHFSETLSGSITIRSFDQESRYRDISLRLIDGYSRPKFNTTGAMECLDVLSFTLFIGALIFLLFQIGTIDPSNAGLAVTYGLK